MQPACLSPKLQAFDAMNASSDLNLATHRDSTSVWDRRGWDGTRERLTLMRWLVGAGGGALAVQGLRQRSFTGSVLAGLGGTLAWWALTGEGDMSEAQHWFRELYTRVAGESGDAIAQTSEESFPASDAPSWTPAVGTGTRHPRAVRS
jgi:hypothetical protein